MKFHVPCIFMSLHAVSWACMQFLSLSEQCLLSFKYSIICCQHEIWWYDEIMNAEPRLIFIMILSVLIKLWASPHVTWVSRAGSKPIWSGKSSLKLIRERLITHSPGPHRPPTGSSRNWYKSSNQQQNRFWFNLVGSHQCERMTESRLILTLLWKMTIHQNLDVFTKEW